MHPMHPMHPMQQYINLYIFLIQVCASMHPMQMIKLLFNSNGLISCLVSVCLRTQTVSYKSPVLGLKGGVNLL